MSKLCVQNLGMIIGEKCNLNCGHCLRGKCSNKVMSDDVISATLDQIDYIGNLAICGGEPTLALKQLESVLTYITEHKVLLDEVTLVINGTIYSEKLLELLDYIYEYLTIFKNREKRVSFTISHDPYHLKEIERLNLRQQYLENILKYKESKYFFGLQKLYGKLFREGNAEKLSDELTVPLRPMKVVSTYVGKFHRLDTKKGVCNIGPLITVNTDGILTECDASYEHQLEKYNYGNVLTDSIEELFTKKEMILKPRAWNKETEKIFIKHATYQD